ncbi:hypothetical protein [Phenylobacterium sp.]|uniref:hypothetical protein n=1 Tax=Phenylobacterium sp. TaxID=1871053 RepID=UPI0035B47A3A
MLKPIRGQSKVLGGRRRGAVAAVIDNDAALYLSKIGGTSKAYAAAVNRLFLRLKASGVWPYVRSGYLFAAPTAAGAVKNIVPGAGDATVTGVPHTANKGFNGVPPAGGMSFANTATGFTYVGGHGYAFAGRGDLSQAATEYSSYGTGIPNILISGDQTVCQGLRYSTPQVAWGGRGSWLIGGNSGPRRMIVGEGCAPEVPSSSPVYGYFPRANGGNYSGGGGFGLVNTDLRVWTYWNATVFRHSVWLFTDATNAAFPLNGMQAVVDIVSDFCDDTGCID